MEFFAKKKKEGNYKMDNLMNGLMTSKRLLGQELVGVDVKSDSGGAELRFGEILGFILIPLKAGFIWTVDFMRSWFLSFFFFFFNLQGLS